MHIFSIKISVVRDHAFNRNHNLLKSVLNKEFREKSPDSKPKEAFLKMEI